MTSTQITTVRFQNYWKLLKRMAPAVKMCIVYNQDGHFIWQNAAKIHPQMERITVMVRSFQKQAAQEHLKSTQYDLSADTLLQIFYLHDKEIDQTLTLALISDPVADPEQLKAEKDESIGLLNNSLLSEYSLVYKISEKEQELNSIVDELTHRYEELNLIYSSDDNAQNNSHGREMLNNIVMNASNFMDIDRVALVLPEKNIVITHSQHLKLADNNDDIIRHLKKNIYPHLAIYKSPIVINRYEDATSLNLITDLPYKMLIVPMLNADNEVIGMMAIFNSYNRIDFTNSDRNLLEVLSNKATNLILHNFDPLTGLENSHSFELIVLDSLKQTWRMGSQHAVAMIDIDRLSVINGLGGLETGDKLIKEIAGILTRQVHSYDTVARLSGNKFALLLKNNDLDEALERMNKISQVVNQIELDLGQDVHEVSISIGLAPITADVQNVSSVLTNVESALKAGKERGPNQIQVFRLDDSELLRRKEEVKWVSRTQAALREDRFQIFAQLIHPISKTHRLPHYEILLRLKNEEGGMVPPAFFLPAAENFYLMPKIDRWVIQKTFELLHDVTQREGNPMCEVSINLSGQSISDPELGNYIESMLHQYQVDPKLVCFEVTESAAIANLDDAQKFIQRIQQFGSKFSLDDFGTGQSSFAYLKNLSVNYLKIDGSFVRNLVDDPISQSMVTAINQVAHAMGLQTIAEFVEDDDILNCLQEIGVDYAQGYGVDKPRPLTDKFAQLATKPLLSENVS